MSGEQILNCNLIVDFFEMVYSYSSQKICLCMQVEPNIYKSLAAHVHTQTCKHDSDELKCKVTVEENVNEVVGGYLNNKVDLILS
jgi:hypothetical protein